MNILRRSDRGLRYGKLETRQIQKDIWFFDHSIFPIRNAFKDDHKQGCTETGQTLPTILFGTRLETRYPWNIKVLFVGFGLVSNALS